MAPPVDLRSDTVTRPTDEMRRAMAAADVGDDVYGEDPSVNALEAEVAELFDHEAAMFVPSGTMANLIAVQLLCRPGEDLLCDADAHIVNYESGATAVYGGVQTRTIVGDRGRLRADAVAPQLRVAGHHTVTTVAVAVEQTHNRGGGSVYSLADLEQLRALTAAHGARLHCDGARIWNAHVASGVGLATYGALFDTISVALSKGLGAPVGSLVVMRERAMLETARELRHRLGGGMRQAGLLAAAGRHALRHHLERLADDHSRARRLATRLAEVAPQLTDPSLVETNMVLVDLTGSAHDAASLAAACAADGVLVSSLGPRTLRLVTHLDVDDAGIERACEVLARRLAG